MCHKINSYVWWLKNCLFKNETKLKLQQRFKSEVHNV